MLTHALKNYIEKIFIEIILNLRGEKYVSMVTLLEINGLCIFVKKYKAISFYYSDHKLATLSQRLSQVNVEGIYFS